MAIEVASAAIRMEPDFTGFAGAVGQGVQGQSRQIAGAATQLGGALTAAVTVPVAAIGISAVKSFADFDEALTSSLAIVEDFGTTTRDDFEKTAREVARTSRFTAAEAAQSFFFLASAGLSAEQQLAALPQVAKFAQAGMFDMATATDLATDAQSALGLAVDDPTQNLENLTRVTDVFVKANILANTSVQQVSEAFTNKYGAALRAYRIEVEEGTAVLAAFADQGVKGSEAGEAAAIVYRDLKRAASENKAEFEKAGIAVFDANGNFRNTADIVEDLTTAFGDLSVEQQTILAQQLGFQDRSFKNIQLLFGTADAIREYEAALLDAGGVTEIVAERQLQSFSAQLDLVKSRLSDAAITLGEELAPFALQAASALAGVAEFFTSLPDPIKRTITILAAFAAAAGPILLIGGKLAQATLALRTLRLTSGRGTAQALAYGAAQRQAALATAGLGIAAGKAAPQVTALAGAQSFTAGGRISTGLVRGGGPAAVSGINVAGQRGGRLAGLGLAGAGRAAGAAGLGLLAGDLLGSLVQSVETQEGTAGDQIKDSIGNAVRFGVAGAAAGFAVGGPVGAAVGAAGGAVVGGLIGYFRSRGSTEPITEAVEESAREAIADGLEGLELSDREIQTAAQVLDASIAKVIRAAGEGGLTQIEAAGVGDKVEKVIANLLKEGFDADEIAGAIEPELFEGLADGIDVDAITQQITDQLSGLDLTEVFGGGERFAESLQPEFSAVFREALEAGADVVAAFNAGIAQEARDIDLSLVADAFVAEVATIPSIFADAYDETRKVSTDKLLEIAQANAEGAAAFTENIRTLTEAGLVNLASQIADKGPAAAAEAEALAGDLETALRIEATLKGIAAEDIDAFLGEFEGADPAAISEAFIEQFIDPLTDDRIAAEAADLAAGVDFAINSILNTEAGSAAAKRYINGLTDTGRMELEASVGAFIQAGQSPLEAINSILSGDVASAQMANYNQGLEDGVDFSGAAEKAGTEATAINDIVGLTLGIGSPSTITIAYGEDYGAGLEEGLTTGLAGSPALVGSAAGAINDALVLALNPNDAERAGRQYIEGLNRGLGAAIITPSVGTPTGGAAGSGTVNNTKTTNINISNPSVRDASTDAQRARLLDDLAGVS